MSLKTQKRCGRGAGKGEWEDGDGDLSGNATGRGLDGYITNTNEDGREMCV